MERGLKIPQSERTKTTNSLLISLMKQLEKVSLSLFYLFIYYYCSRSVFFYFIYCLIAEKIIRKT